MPAIKAITFDLWDTIVHDDSDEPRRAALGLRTKHDERRHLIWEALNRYEAIDLESVTLAYDTADAGFNITWKECSLNWTLRQRLRAVLIGLGRALPEADFERLVHATGMMEVEIPPDPIAGITEALTELSRRYKLAVVSDAIVTPGTGLRQILEHHGLKHYFSGFAFSDEVGHSKPHRAMFDTAAEQLEVEIPEIIHIGDRDHNDVKGPQAIGAKAILFTASRPADRAATSADGICDHYRDLAASIDRIANSRG